jgi:hypothetical protein
MNTKLKLIIILLIFVILYSIVFIIVQVQNDEFLHNKHVYMDYETWSESNWRDVWWYPDYYQEFRDIEALIVSIYTLIATPIAIAGCIGLILKKNWGRILSIIAMGMIALFFSFSLINASLAQLEQYLFNFVSVAITILIRQAFLVLSILSLLYLIKPQVKEIFQSEKV